MFKKVKLTADELKTVILKLIESGNLAAAGGKTTVLQIKATLDENEQIVADVDQIAAALIALFQNPNTTDLFKICYSATDDLLLLELK